MFQTLISVSELATRRREDWVIVDCRFQLADSGYGRRAFAESHIPGALYAHLEEDLSGPLQPGIAGRHPLPEFDPFCELLGRWGVRPTSQIVAYDDGPGPLAARLWWNLRYLGHTAVAVLNGGFAAWTASGGGLSQAESRLEPVDAYPGVPHPEMVVAAEDVLDSTWTLVDARAPARYRGEAEPIDPIAGRIPGAISRPFQENIGKDGSLQPASALRDRFLGLGAPEKVVHYCGSGVTAAYNLLAMEVAGLPGARLYPGSWSEWITDPARPVETG